MSVPPFESILVMKVVVEGTTMTIEMSRSDLNKPYVGNKAGLEFTYGNGTVKI